MSLGGNSVRFSAIMIVATLLALGLCLPLAVASAEDEGAAVYSLSGKVYDAAGELVRGPFQGAPTRVAIDALGIATTVTSEGTYRLENVPAGEHIVKVFYGSIDQTYTYRSVDLDADTVIDWYYGKTWVQGTVLDGSYRPMATVPANTPVRVTVVETGQYDETDENGYFEIANVSIGQYYTIKALFGTLDRSTSFTVREIVGSAPNQFEFVYGHNAVYGYVKDEGGALLSGESVSISPHGRSTITNEDGFYLFENVTVGTEQTIQVTLASQGGQVLTATKSVVKSAMLFANFTTAESLQAPEFLTESGTVGSGAYTISWGAVAGADSYILYEGGSAIYTGTSTSFDVAGRIPGTYMYTVRAVTGDVQGELSGPILIDVIGSGGSDATWSPGMSWTFQFRSEKSGAVTTDTVTMTVISVETIHNITGVPAQAFKVREIYASEPDVLRYSWYDVDSLDMVAKFSVGDTYTSTTNATWVYDGEPFPYAVGNSVPVRYHHTTVVTIQGHSDVNVWANATLEVVGMEMVTVPAGTFLCYNITVTDDVNGRVHWNYYYNETVRHWVKMVDRLPTTRADMVTYELTGFNVPEGPVFITESGERNTGSYAVEWADYDGAVEYILYENGEEVYRGTATSFEAVSKRDGTYEYIVEAVLSSGQRVSSGTLTIVADYIVPVPDFTTESGTVESGEITISWNAVEGADRYVLYENDVEIYNGPETSFTVTDRADGTYRYRVQAVDGDKISGLSPSLFMTVENKENNDTGSGWLTLLAVAVGVAAVVGAVLLVMRRRV